MAITLITGLPGHGKTLNGIKEARDYAIAEGRVIYYYNIKELSQDLGWHEIDDPKQWFELPPGSIIFLDECQHYFPARASGKNAPQWISEFNTHRHKGYDIFLVTQNPKLIDHDIRFLVNRHLHFFRPFGLNRTTRIEWARCIDDPFKDSAHKSAISSSTVKLDDKVFDLYKSAEVHTVKAKIPNKIYYYATLPIILILIVLFSYSKISDPVPSDVKAKNKLQEFRLSRTSSGV